MKATPFFRILVASTLKKELSGESANKAIGRDELAANDLISQVCRELFLKRAPDRYVWCRALVG